jgi:hypothetical protein
LRRLKTLFLKAMNQFCPIKTLLFEAMQRLCHFMTHNCEVIKRLRCFKTINFEAEVKLGIGHRRDCRGHESDFRGRECARTLLELTKIKLNCKYLISSN